MKARLLKKLRSIGRDMVAIYSVTKTNGVVTGMRIGYDDSIYSGLFEFGDTEVTVKEKACKIYLKNNIEQIRKRYKKFTRKNKLK